MFKCSVPKPHCVMQHIKNNSRDLELHHLVSPITYTDSQFVIIWHPGRLQTLLILLADVIIWPLGPEKNFSCQSVLNCFDNEMGSEGKHIHE